MFKALKQIPEIGARVERAFMYLYAGMFLIIALQCTVIGILLMRLP